MHWARLVLGASHPITIAAVLALLGVGICWFSLQQIASLSKAPTRYEIIYHVTTSGCEGRELVLKGHIGAFDSSAIYLSWLDSERNLLLREGCWLQKIVLQSRLPLKPRQGLEGSRLIMVQGQKVEVLRELIGEDWPENFLYEHLETVEATTVANSLSVVDAPEALENGPSFAMRLADAFGGAGHSLPYTEYEILFSEHWQPADAFFYFSIPESVFTSFNVYGVQEDVGGDEPDPSFKRMESEFTFWTDEVSILRGSISESGVASSVGGAIRFGVENNDAESRRESGNVRYSAVLGIGIALLVEAFVIFLALGLNMGTRAFASRVEVDDVREDE